ncbi:hypothetical protein SAMN02745216_04858 [Desulfatibacillum alkenivorans DSM 16219]|uniref:Mut7-C RNAse domain-containing protein n=1 Tax=Desulfatibacillum alkenivorans DSM 16219 TaxID=1121393 RepID=A0A1M6YXI7_9BACT|nr:Mut7-C RNAse domain-containing protein [Desulfatibacillum alkenivorans]SHL23034.1 hypothetical protein SAMN02745216_04858 [Desulfatibacillum alkenivorans DSM 16219]
MAPLLAVDRSMGRLAKWLRLLGYDTVFDPGMGDKEFLALAEQGRILITRTRALFGKAGEAPMVEIVDGDPKAQLAETVKRLGLRIDRERAFGRCIRCNVPVEPMERSEVFNRVPDYVFEAHQDFAHCPRCKRIYWQGSHQDRGLAMLESVI